MSLRRNAVLVVAALLAVAAVAAALPQQASTGMSHAQTHSGRDVPANGAAGPNGTHPGNGTHAGGLATALEHVPAGAARVLHAIEASFAAGGHALGNALAALLGHGAAAAGRHG